MGARRLLLEQGPFRRRPLLCAVAFSRWIPRNIDAHLSMPRLLLVHRRVLRCSVSATSGGRPTGRSLVSASGGGHRLSLPLERCLRSRHSILSGMGGRLEAVYPRLQRVPTARGSRRYLSTPSPQDLPRPDWQRASALDVPHPRAFSLFREIGASREALHICDRLSTPRRERLCALR